MCHLYFTLSLKYVSQEPIDAPYKISALGVKINVFVNISMTPPAVKAEK